MLLIALLPEAFMLGASYVWIETSIEHEMSFLADATARRADNILKVTQSNLKQLAEQTSARCDQSAVDFMRDKVFKVMYIRETGIINDNKLMCNNVKLFKPPVEITNIEQRRIPDKDGDITLIPPLPTLQGGKSILVNYRVSASSYVNALIDPDIFAEFHEYVRLGEVSGVFLVREDGKAVISFGSMPERDLPPITANAEHIRLYHENLFSIYKSDDFPIYAVVAASPTFIFKQWCQDALFLAALGGFMSVALIFLLKKNRRRSNLLQDELWQAIDKNELCIHYQPIIDMVNNRCVGAEALIRWQHPDRGMIMPLVFIPIAEQTGMIRYITHWLIHRVELELGDFLIRNPDIHISINLSPADLGADGNKAVSDDLLFKRIPHKQIIYEITEHSLMPDHVKSVYEIMESLRKKGAKLAVDDFGTGYSSLSYLQRFPLDYLKIDKAFVDTIQSETSSTGLIDHVINIASAMQYDLIAEGIEHNHQMTYLKGHGVRFGQGFYFAKPSPVKEFIAFIKEKNLKKIQVAISKF
ncbi:EAL domain-containing protein [Methyloglobulus sp.]|uniref:EAL domain-containing protein n=1 Tax=Methyloglobulus sp. TaxID=2518622 RepID=UPI0032B72CA0